MKSFEELVNIARDHSYPPNMTKGSSDFKDFLSYACEIQKKSIEQLIFVESLDAQKRQRLNGFMDEYGGHKSDHLETLYEKHGLTADDRKDAELLIEQADRSNMLFHAAQDLSEDCARKVEKEMVKAALEYLKSKKSKLPKNTYRSMKSEIKKWKKALSDD